MVLVISIMLKKGIPRSQRAIDLSTGICSVGRANCDLIIPDPCTSRLHARLYCRDGGLILEDLKSRNGTYLNGNAVVQCRLKVGDVFKIGKARIKVRIISTSKATAPPEPPTPAQVVQGPDHWHMPFRSQGDF